MLFSNKRKKENKENKTMTNTKYTKDEKAKLTQRLLTPENYSITKLANEAGISKSILSTWKSNK